MDGTIRIRSVVWTATVVLMAVVSTLLVTQAWSASAAPGDADSTFVPTPGCRIADTRPAPNTIGLRSAPLFAGDVFEVAVHGENGECTGALGIPDDAVAVSLNVTAVNATARSNIRVYPADLAEVPLLSNLNVTAGAPATPNKVDVKLSADGKIRVFNFQGSVNLVIDVVGYYTDSSLNELSQALLAAEARIGALEAAQPFAVSESFLPVVASGVSDTPRAFVSVVVTAPVAGQVTLNSTAIVFVSSDGGNVFCAIYETADIPAVTIVGTPSIQRWQTGGSGRSGTLSGTRTFNVAAGATVSYSLACETRDSVSAVLTTSNLTAIFTPAR